jgi:hypothetical protein
MPLGNQVTSAVQKLNKPRMEQDDQILKMIVSKHNPKSVFFLGMTDISFYSPDCGRTLTAF